MLNQPAMVDYYNKKRLDHKFKLIYIKYAILPSGAMTYVSYSTLDLSQNKESYGRWNVLPSFYWCISYVRVCIYLDTVQQNTIERNR